jgi:3-oxoacyl-[acyl-carrier-protein] synthase-3
MAYVLAPYRITSSYLEDQISDTMERLGVPKGQIERLTGIRERRFWDADLTPSEIATMAARKVLDITGIDSQKIGCMINSSVCKDYIEPSVACLVHGNLKLSSRCINYDIGNACLGFLNAMDTIILMIEAGMIDYGLVVNGETSREAVEATIKRLQAPDVPLQTFRDNFATLTLGSGGVAMILARKDLSKTGHVINGSVNRAATQYNRLCLGQRTEMLSDPHALMLGGLELATETWQAAQEQFENWHDDNIVLYAPHQTSVRHMQALVQTIDVSLEKIYLNLYTQGNVGPASLPIAMAMAVEDGRIQPGDHVAFLGIGSGLNCTMMSVSW